MATVNTVDKMKAAAVGGPVAGAEYVAAQKGAIDTRQQALSDAASRAGAINAPQQFLNSQAGKLDVPLSAAIQSLGTQGSAASGYGNALNSAQGQYMGALNASQGLVQQRLQQENENPYDGTAGSIFSQLAAQKKAAEGTKKSEAAANEKALNKENDARKEFARQDAAANQNLKGDTYDAISDVLKNSGDLDTALRYIEGFTTDDKGNYVDKDGNALDIDPNALLAYTMKALDPEAFAKALVDDPTTYGKYAQ